MAREDSNGDVAPAANEASVLNDRQAHLDPPTTESDMVAAEYHIDNDKRKAKRIRDLGEDERPREKLIEHGARTLGNAELIALLLRTGLPGQNVVDLSRELLGAHGGTLTDLSRAQLAALQNTPGIGPAKAAELAAVFELAARLARERIMRARLDSPEAVYDFIGPAMANLDREVIRVVLVNARQRHIRTEEISVGAIDQCIAHPALILKPVITSSAHGFFLIHNHPSGDPSPSSPDRALTRRVAEACELLEIRFIDHVIVGSSTDSSIAEPYFSFKEMGLL